MEDKIRSYIQQYRSDCFPYGLEQVFADYTITSNDQGYLLTVSLAFPCFTALQTAIETMAETLDVNMDLKAQVQVEAVREHNIAGVKNIIAVASGKGGVGKSTTAVNIALALQEEGARVGILDADIYGPSIPTMLGIADEKPGSEDGKRMLPLNGQGLSAMSIGFLVPDSQASIWRGPMASTAFTQLLNETAWDDLDYLIVDMPPGTGDIQLTLAQKVPVAAACMVTTPQDIALIDVRKGISMFDKVQVPVLGVIENMSYHLCPNCGHESHIFGEGGAQHLASEQDIDLLGQIPLNLDIRQGADSGNSPILSNIDSDISQIYRRIATNIVSDLYYQLDWRSPATATLSITEE
ncbi:iron-sulfur cluster carrier protein ApbC [Thalassotalea sp. PS06]|uniref:iron-sulfur cluster carrier protein ApbC n=1 Tax=Thalassotalea sp. PS06 TaxID=2594005 RepID=UPI001161E63A|nr:iron-sulfur cluster carrier protein ApbC [Thalassotalea sp. PS06]QDP01097.1 iron-sulfur cluster carrier protein ApbC [Thalassotalea sp. PS06]